MLGKFIAGDFIAIDMYIHTYMYITHNMSLPKNPPKLVY
jgi:hypothetical protein